MGLTGDAWCAGGGVKGRELVEGGEAGRGLGWARGSLARVLKIVEGVGWLHGWARVVVIAGGI